MAPVKNHKRNDSQTNKWDFNSFVNFGLFQVGEWTSNGPVQLTAHYLLSNLT